MNRRGEKRSRRRKSYRAAFVTGISICILAAAAGMGTVTLARYISGQESGWFQIMPERFYFTSDQLDKKGTATTELYYWNPDEDYIFFMDIRNWEDDLRVSKSTVVFEVATEGAAEITSAVVLPGNNTQTQASYELPGGLITTRKLLITIPKNITPAGNQVKVTVKARPEGGKGYTKTLSGTFQLNKGARNVNAEAEVHNGYIDLVIGVDQGQVLQVDWPAWLTPDNTNPWLTDAVGTGSSVTLEDRSSCRLRFFAVGERTGTDGFTVTEAGGTGKVHPVTISQ